jgi:hypothetical protein
MPLNTGSNLVSAQPQSTTSAVWFAVAYSTANMDGTNVTADAYNNNSNSINPQARTLQIIKSPPLEHIK